MFLASDRTPSRQAVADRKHPVLCRDFLRACAGRDDRRLFRRAGDCQRPVPWINPADDGLDAAVHTQDPNRKQGAGCSSVRPRDSPGTGTISEAETPPPRRQDIDLPAGAKPCQIFAPLLLSTREPLARAPYCLTRGGRYWRSSLPSSHSISHLTAGSSTIQRISGRQLSM